MLRGSGPRRAGAASASKVGGFARPLRQRLRLPLMLAGPILVLIAASWWYLTSGRYVSTDDSYVQAARTMISTDVSGRVVAVAVQRLREVPADPRLDPNAQRRSKPAAKGSMPAFNAFIWAVAVLSPATSSRCGGARSLGILRSMAFKSRNSTRVGYPGFGET